MFGDCSPWKYGPQSWVQLIYLGKMWFLDRMVWLYEDMKDTTPEYRSWLY